ncbi:MAG: glycosyltransferase family 2 protein [Bdellovibrionales bacterium]
MTVMNQSDVIAVIVTFNPSGDVAGRMHAVAAEAQQIVVIDNASDSAFRSQLASIQNNISRPMECIWNERNRGLAVALNQGITRALEKGAGWILLLDHDSQPRPGMVACMLKAYTARPSPENIALIAPDIQDENAGAATRYLFPRGKFGFRRTVLNQPFTEEVLTVITSGSLVKATTFRNMGLMPEAFFIDYVDHAYCLRIRKRGAKILLVREAVLRHRLGEKTAHKLAGMTVVTANHSSFRRYYIFRNRVWVWKLYGRRFPGFVLHDLLASGLDIFRILVYEKQKLPKLKSLCRGLAAGIGRSPADG